MSFCPGPTKVRSLASFTAARNGMRWNLCVATSIQPAVCAMHSISSTPGISGWPGKWPSNTMLSSGTVASQRMVRAERSRLATRSISRKYSRRIGVESGALGGDEFVDALAQILQDEILFGGGLALVDL